MTKRKWEGNDALKLDSVDECLNRPAAPNWQPTVEQKVSPPAVQPATEGGTPSWVEVATLATSAAYQGGPPNWTGGGTAVAAVTNEDELRACTQVATVATSAVVGDTSQIRPKPLVGTVRLVEQSRGNRILTHEIGINKPLYKLAGYTYKNMD